MNLQDQQILNKLKQGDQSGYKELFDCYYMPLCVFAMKYIDSFDQVEDIVQDVFVKFWDAKTYLRIEGTIKSYFFTAVKNNCINLRKINNKYRFDELEDQVDSLLDDEISHEELEAMKDKLYIEIEALPEKTREVFKAIVLENLKYKEAAEQFGVSVNTIKTNFSRALKQLRQSNEIIILLLLA